MSTGRLDPARDWFAARGWSPFSFQEETWRRYLDGESGLVHAPTGFGKSLSAWMGPLLQARAAAPEASAPTKRADAAPLAVVWITPMRALASDLVRKLGLAAADLCPHWLVEGRSGDTGSTERSRQTRRLPSALVAAVCPARSLLPNNSHRNPTVRDAALRSGAASTSRRCRARGEADGERKARRGSGAPRS